MYLLLVIDSTEGHTRREAVLSYKGKTVHFGVRAHFSAFRPRGKADFVTPETPERLSRLLRDSEGLPGLLKDSRETPETPGGLQRDSRGTFGTSEGLP